MLSFAFMAELILNPLQVSWGVWLITLACAFIIGFSKSGLKGIGMVTIPVLAIMYGGMFSAGILLPFLVFGDLFAVRFYRKNMSWSHVKRLMPFALAGILLAVLVGKMISDDLFRNLMAVLVISCLALIVFFDFSGKKPDFSKSGFLSGFTGLSGGFATMIGNAAGPIFDLYLLSMRLPKNSFIGTGAIFFLTLNIIKVPLHFFVWESITLASLQMNFVMVPAVFIGALAGRKVVSYIPEKGFRIIVIVIIALSSILLLLR
ncbi:hypothetical protein EV194_101684 [Natronoflexus pectinivorans]|uniref:Probable membrane transporter protein n=2 Tax=Natronoflexus pectinivorans TaxID=682526 RepID=A0A4R2GPI2_9BACT|nr:hypothetical protein EV194_101684 [Natronoflexus pectinivorans]